MNTGLLRRARRLWSSQTVPAEMNRVNQLKWARAVHALGDKWVVLRPVGRSA